MEHALPHEVSSKFVKGSYSFSHQHPHWEEGEVEVVPPVSRTPGRPPPLEYPVEASISNTWRRDAPFERYSSDLNGIHLASSSVHSTACFGSDLNTPFLFSSSSMWRPQDPHEGQETGEVPPVHCKTPSWKEERRASKKTTRKWKQDMHHRRRRASSSSSSRLEDETEERDIHKPSTYSYASSSRLRPPPLSSTATGSHAEDEVLLKSKKLRKKCLGGTQPIASMTSLSSHPRTPEEEEDDDEEEKEGLKKYRCTRSPSSRSPPTSSCRTFAGRVPPFLGRGALSRMGHTHSMPSPRVARRPNSFSATVEALATRAQRASSWFNHDLPDPPRGGVGRRSTTRIRAPIVEEVKTYDMVDDEETDEENERGGGDASYYISPLHQMIAEMSSANDTTTTNKEAEDEEEAFFSTDGNREASCFSHASPSRSSPFPPSMREEHSNPAPRGKGTSGEWGAMEVALRKKRAGRRRKREMDGEEDCLSSSSGSPYSWYSEEDNDVEGGEWNDRIEERSWYALPGHSSSGTCRRRHRHYSTSRSRSDKDSLEYEEEEEEDDDAEEGGESDEDSLCVIVSCSVEDMDEMEEKRYLKAQSRKKRKRRQQKRDSHLQRRDAGRKQENKRRQEEHDRQGRERKWRRLEREVATSTSSLLAPLPPPSVLPPPLSLPPTRSMLAQSEKQLERLFMQTRAK